MAAAGSAVGLGNIWKFPYETGANGGGAFLLLYLLFIVIFGASLILAEMVLGRASGRNPVGAFRLLGGGAWPGVGYLGVFTGFVLYFFSDIVFALGLSDSIPVLLAAWTPSGVATMLGTAMLFHLEDG